MSTQSFAAGRALRATTPATRSAARPSANSRSSRVMPTDSDYPVGYGRPPRQTRFRKGQSGNPMGRPKGAKNLATLIGQVLKEPVVVSENGRRKKITKREAMLKQLVNRAAAGEH